jgi:hypothetical protein
MEIMRQQQMQIQSGQAGAIIPASTAVRTEL